MCVNGSVRNTCSKGNINSSKYVLAATDEIYEYILRSKCGKTPEMFSIKRVWFIIVARKGISIVHVASMRWQQQTRYVYKFFVLNVGKHQKCFL